jgi:hypothetical protein
MKAANKRICAIGVRRKASFNCSNATQLFVPSLTFTIEQQNKFLSLVTTFDQRRRGRRIDEVPNSTNALTLAAIFKQTCRQY